MVQTLGKLVGLICLLGVGVSGIVLYRHVTRDQRSVDQLRQQNTALAEQKRVLEDVVGRLSSDRRVADVIVTDQARDADGKLRSTLLLVETDRAGESLPPKRFEVVGDNVHVDGMVIEFRRDLVAGNDPLRGHAIALFTRVYGDDQRPSDVPPIDVPGQIPAFYRGISPQVSRYEQELWQSFWKLADDAALRQERGVHVAVGKSVWRPMKPGVLYTLTLQPDGNVSCTDQPVPGIYRELMRGKN